MDPGVIRNDEGARREERAAAGSVVGSTSPSRHTRPRHLAIARWRPKISKIGVAKGGET